MTDASRAGPPVPSQLGVDTSRWPIVVLTMLGQPSDQQWAAHLREIEEKVLARREPFVQVVDQRQGEMPDAIQRRLIADHQERMDESYRLHCLGEVYVVSPRTRGAMQAVFWLAKPSYPYTFVEELRDALEWARRRLQESATPSV